MGSGAHDKGSSSGRGGGAGTKLRAIAILKDTTWCKNFSEDLLNALASKMELVEVDDGHVFIHEGEELKHFYIVEEGVIVRTKLSVDEEEEVTKCDRPGEHALHHHRNQSAVEAAADEIKGVSSRPSQVWNKLDEKCVVIDRIQGRGRVTGILHNIVAKKKAYATAVAKGHVKVGLSGVC